MALLARNRLIWLRERSRGTLAVGAAIALLTALCYFNSLENEFTYDDKAIVLFNPLVKSIRNIPEIFASSYWGSMSEGGLYRPLTVASFTLDHALAGSDPTYYRITNILLHSLNAFLLYTIAILLGRSRGTGLVVALLFAAHPVHTEAVVGIVGRSEILSTLFILAGLLAYLKSFYVSSGRRLVLVVVSTGSFLLALLSKETGILVPLVYLAGLHAYTPPGRAGGGARPADDERRLLPLFAQILVLGLYLMIRGIILGPRQFLGPSDVSLLDNPIFHEGPGARTLTALFVLWRYLVLLFWPQQLSADYSYNQIPVLGAPLPTDVLLGVVAGAWIAVALLVSYRRSPIYFFGIALFAATYLPVSNLLFPIGTIMAERLVYLPSVGFCVVAGEALAWLWRNIPSGYGSSAFRVGLIATVLAVLSLYTVRTVIRNRDWQNDLTLFESAARTSPDSARMHLYLGMAYSDRGEYEKGIEELWRSLAILPRNPDTINRIGQVELALGRYDEAERQFRRAIEIYPEFGDAFSNLGKLFLIRGRYDEAEKNFRWNIKGTPRGLDSRLHLGIALFQQGRTEEAQEELGAILALDPDAIGARYYLGLIALTSGRRDEARDLFRWIHEKGKPWHPAGHNYVALARLEIEEFEKAEEALAAAMAINPRSDSTLINLARLLLRSGQVPEALEAVELALEGSRRRPEALQILGLVRMASDQYEEALKALDESLEINPADPFAHLYRARVLRLMGRWQEAEREVDTIPEPFCDWPEFVVERGDLEFSRGEYRSARTLYERVLTLEPDNVGALFNLAQVLFLLGDAAEAESLFQRASALEPKNPELHAGYGAALQELGRYGEAQAAFERAVARDPRNPRYRFHLGTVQLLLGDPVAAEKELRRSIDLDPESPEAYNALAWLYARSEAPSLRRPQLAIENALTAVRLDSTRSELFDTLAEAYYAAGQSAEAVRAIRKAIELGGAQPYYLGQLRRFQGAN